MPKNLFEDMVRIKREQRDALSVDSSNTLNTTRVENKVPETTTEPQEYTTIENKFASVYDVALVGENKKGTKYTMWFAAGVSVVVLLFALSYLFGSAKIVVTPKAKDVTLAESLSATKDASSEALSFDLVVISGQESKTVAGGEERDVLTRAKGKVIIYNDYSGAVQKLDIDTRLEGSNGKMYKTLTKTTVPGKVKTTPGSVEVAIYAADPGAEFNSGPIDFKIFGFKGTPKYSKFYARSKDKITGGFNGKERGVTDRDKTNAIAELETTLQAKLFKKATDQIPAGFILFKDASFLESEEVSGADAAKPATMDAVANPTTSSMVPITVKGAFYGILFDEKKLTEKLAQDSIQGYEAGSDIYIPNIQNIPFELTDKTTPLKDAKSISFKLSGPAKFVWSVDTAKLATDILGKAKKDFNVILASYPNIDTATITVRPIWKMSFPDKQKDVIVTVTEPK